MISLNAIQSCSKYSEQPNWICFFKESITNWPSEPKSERLNDPNMLKDEYQERDIHDIKRSEPDSVITRDIGKATESSRLKEYLYGQVIEILEDRAIIKFKKEPDCYLTRSIPLSTLGLSYKGTIIPGGLVCIAFYNEGSSFISEIKYLGNSSVKWTPQQLEALQRKYDGLKNSEQ